MQEQKTGQKWKIGYGVFLVLGILLLWLAGEGKQPIFYEGASLQHSVGAPDSDNNLFISEAVARNGVIASTPKYIMNKGTYTVELVYQAQESDSVLELWEQGRKIAGWPLEGENTRYPRHLPFPRMQSSCSCASITAEWVPCVSRRWS